MKYENTSECIIHRLRRVTQNKADDCSGRHGRNIALELDLGVGRLYTYFDV